MLYKQRGMQKRREQISGTIPELMTGGNGPVALDDDNVTQSDTAATNQLIAVVNLVGNEAFVKETKKKPARQTRAVLERKKDWTLSSN